ncbi:MAG: DUF4159 domain-containing protein [Hyphomicrobiales bacterium]
MAFLSALSFLNPLALGALALLPAIWWLLRFTPPRPELVKFPPFRLIRDLITAEDEKDKMPWWLLLLRMALAAALILAVAGPFWRPDGAVALSKGTPLLLVVDDGWAGARDWQAREDALMRRLTDAAEAGAPVALAYTAAGGPAQQIIQTSAEEARRVAAAHEPAATLTDRMALAPALEAAFRDAPALNVVWLSDGLDAGEGQAFGDRLKALAGRKASVQVLRPNAPALPVALAAPALEAGGLKVSALRVPQAEVQRATAALEALNGRTLASVDLAFPANGGKAEASIELPIELRNEAARLVVASERTAGATYLFDDRYRRKVVAMLTGASIEMAQPLLSPLYYVSRALMPSAEIVEAKDVNDLGAAIDRGVSMIVLADIGVLPPDVTEKLLAWVKKGGMLVRFAGPRLAAADQPDPLVPVELRAGGRSLGSALSWEQPQALAAFPAGSPFASIAADPSITVSRQVLANPSPELAERTWASLADGTPLVTAKPEGRGMLVLFHITASPDWSNLPLSGLFVSMLERLNDMSGAGGAGEMATTDEALAPRRTLNGFGELGQPPAIAEPVPAREFNRTTASRTHPAGLYGSRNAQRAINIAPAGDALVPLAVPEGVAVASYAPAKTLDLRPSLFTLALGLLLLDSLVSLFLSGGWRRFVRRTAPAAIAALAFIVVAPGLPFAQETGRTPADDFAIRASTETRLAYVLTGDRTVDDVSLQGLTGLGDALLQRTAVEPGVPVGVNVEKDEIVFFPLLYWPVTPDTPAPSPEAAKKIDAYMKNGGTILFDTRDAGDPQSVVSSEPTPATMALRRILESLDVPALEPVPPEHVLTKAFYLLSNFPGRFANGSLWVEAADRSNLSTGNADGVSAIIIGSNDYAAAWATSTQGDALYPAVPGGERQREMAVRTGINIVMYALTGNYKADQVHVPALLERLGQ